MATREFAGGDYKLADAISVSGAAVSPTQKAGILIRTLLFLGNMRLGQWVANPGFKSWGRTPSWVQDFRYWCYFTVGRLICQRWQFAEQRPFVFLTDGGHGENLGIGALLKRRCRVILAFDAGADEEYQFADLANLSRWAQLSHGVTFTPLNSHELEQLTPSRPLSVLPNEKEMPFRLAEKHWIAARIDYPKREDESKDPLEETLPGVLIYLKATLTGKEPFNVLQFARTHKTFPHDTTVDQCYDSDQFAAYVQLGHHIAQEISQEIKSGDRWLPQFNKVDERDAIRQLFVSFRTQQEEIHSEQGSPPGPITAGGPS